MRDRGRERGQGCAGFRRVRRLWVLLFGQLTRVPSPLGASTCSARPPPALCLLLPQLLLRRARPTRPPGAAASSPHLCMTDFCSSSKALWGEGVRGSSEHPFLGLMAGMQPNAVRLDSLLALSSSSRSMAIC